MGIIIGMFLSWDFTAFACFTAWHLLHCSAGANRHLRSTTSSTSSNNGTSILRWALGVVQIQTTIPHIQKQQALLGGAILGDVEGHEFTNQCGGQLHRSMCFFN
jgi:hypothetical protein